VTHPLHLFTVWNPSYTEDALDTHLSILLDWARKKSAGDAAAEDVYVWWGKIRSKNRDGRLPHHKDVLAIDAQCDEQTETHLYLTDYRSLYVAEVGEITDDDVRHDHEADHVPAYYEGHAIDFWFRLHDIRRLVSDDTPAVILELRKLQNARYHDRPVSLYGGVVELPLIVSRESEGQWFADRKLLTDGALWAERAAELRSDTERLSRELRDDLFGRAIWSALEPTTRSFLASAEAVYRARRDDPGFDLSGVAIEYAKAVETELNALLFPAASRALRSKPPAEREIFIDGRRLDLGGQVSHQTLGALRVLLEKEAVLQGVIRQYFPTDANELLGLVPRQLNAIIEIRNAGAHGERVDRSDLTPIRELVIGIGQEGLLVRLARARLRRR